MIHRFGRFELDEGKRQLRLSGISQPLQPRVFDLLIYLVRHRERVVSKDELLDQIWPNVTVTDSSIMRAVSVIRSILRRGDLPDAIETSSRQGYRFTAELIGGDAPSVHPSVARARAAYDQGDWATALRRFRVLSARERLRPPDLEAWGHAALNLGRPGEAVAPFERAVAAHMENADRIGAARSALMLTNLHLEDRAGPVAKGWHRRAAVFLRDEKSETREHGMHRWLAARIALFEGDLPGALANAKEAEAMAKRLEDPDVEALGLIYQSHVELATGDIQNGLLHLDEAGAAALGGTVGPWVCGVVFCSVIWMYLDRGDIGRAGQWTDQFIRWCRQNTSFGYPGLCRLHRGEVLCARGHLNQAEAEIEKARELLAENARYAEGDAWRVLGEIRFLRGDFDGADEAFRTAHELGWHPLPGWALLQSAKGDHDGAIKSLQSGLKFPNWANGQRRGLLLGHLARVAARAGRKALANRALAELHGEKSLRSTAGCEAVYQEATAEVAVVHGDLEAAIQALRAALRIWLEIGSRIHAAYTRLRLSEVLALHGEATEAELERTSAEKTFVKFGAEAVVEQCQRPTKK